MAKKKAKLARLDKLKRERAEIIRRYKEREIKSWECRAELNRIGKAMEARK